ncbi:hypothetical protein D4R87_02985 [bacterium]|nr:MAG: hypothetical protein D4R87_02985 [bacterium]
MKKATLAQGNQILNLILQKEIPVEQLQKIIESGLLTDLLNADLSNPINRGLFRKVIGIKSQYPHFHLTKKCNDIRIEALLLKAGLKSMFNSADINSDKFPNNKRMSFETDIQFIRPIEFVKWSDNSRPLNRTVVNNYLQKKNCQFIDIFQLLFFKIAFIDTRLATTNKTFFPDSLNDFNVVTVDQNKIIHLCANEHENHSKSSSQKLSRDFKIEVFDFIDDGKNFPFSVHSNIHFATSFIQNHN